MFQEILGLSPEQVTLGFEILSQPYGSVLHLPPELQKLSQNQWAQLSFLLLSLMKEREYSLLH
jgi:hypothetical protein